MTTHEASVSSESLAILLYNAGISAENRGRLDEAAELLGTASHLSRSRPEISIAACKVYFGLGLFDEAQNYLEAAAQAGGVPDMITLMRRAIERARIITADPRQHPTTTFDPYSPAPYCGSWIISFCDWLESTIYEFCHNLRESEAREWR